MAKKSIISPLGEAVFPRINGKPDTKFDKDGRWKTGLRLSSNDAETVALMKTLDEEHKKSLAAANADPKMKGKKFKLGSKPYTVEKETDTVLFNFSMAAKYEDKKTKEVKDMRPAVFGPDGKPLGADVRVGGGSKIQVAYGIGYTLKSDKELGNRAYVKLYLNAVMIHELVEFGGNAASYGFDVSAAAEAASEDEDETNEDTDSTDDSDDTGASADDF